MEVTAFAQEANTLFRNLSGCRFLDVTNGSGLGPPSWHRLGFGTCALDVDHDGNLDLVVAEPSNYQARLALAHSLLGDARMPEAEQELSACRRLRPEAAEPLVGLAKCAIEQDNLDAAEKLLTQAKERDRNSTFVLEEFAALYLRRQKLDDAIATLNQLVTIAPNNRQAHLQLSQALLATGNPTEAQFHERRYQELDKLEEQRLAARRGMR